MFARQVVKRAAVSNAQFGLTRRENVQNCLVMMDFCLFGFASFLVLSDFTEQVTGILKLS